MLFLFSKLQRLLGNCLGGRVRMSALLHLRKPHLPPLRQHLSLSQAISLSPSSSPSLSSIDLCSAMPNPPQSSTVTLDDLASQLSAMSLTLSTQITSQTEQVSVLRQEVAECQEDNRILREEVRRRLHS